MSSMFTHIVKAFNFDGAVISTGLLQRSKEVNPDIPVPIIVSVTLSEEVPVLKNQVVTNPHDFTGEVIRIYNEIRL